MAENNQRTKPCPYCGGSGKRTAIYADLVWNYPYEIKCADCNGAGQVCILCIKPTVDCQCPSTAFDGDYSGMDRPMKGA